MAVIALAGVHGGRVAAQMPDARTMSGVPMPVDDLPAGTVSVRLVRGDLANLVANHAVELRVGGTPQMAQTDAGGRAVFSGVAAGATVVASATLDGERLESQPFSLPAAGGVRVLLAGTAGGARAPTEPTTGTAAPGRVVLAGGSRVVIEFTDDELTVFYLFDIVNPGATPVETAPLVFEMPAGTEGTGVLEGSSPQAVADGARVTVSGPFKPGTTTVQMAYSILPAGSRVRLVQKLPVALAQVSLLVQKAGGLTLASPSIRDQREVVDGGRTLIMGSGPGIEAGGTLEIGLAGLPHPATWPARLALSLASVVLAFGAYGAVRAAHQGGSNPARQRLETRREQILGELVKLDAHLRAGRVDATRHATRRQALVAELERIYGELDTPATDAATAAERPAG